MYVTAHRVRSPEGAVGINGSLYLHGRSELPENLDIEAVAEEPPGETVVSQLQVRPGGNFVDSYLDVVTLDDMDAQQLSGSLTAIGRKLQGARPDSKRLVEHEDVQVRFYCSRRVPDKVSDEFERLARVVVSLAAQREEHRRDDVPLRIREIREGGVTQFELSAQTKQVLDEADLRPRDYEIVLTNEVRRELTALHGSIYPLLPDLLLDPSADASGIFTDVHVIDDESGEIIWTTRQSEEPD